MGESTEIRFVTLLPRLLSLLLVAVVWWFACLTAAGEVPGSNPRCRQFSCFSPKITAIRIFWHGLHTYCSDEVDSAFRPPRDGKMSISLMATSECVARGQPTGGLKGQDCSWACPMVGGHLIQVTQVNSGNGFA